jgi:cell division control protein 6
MTLLFETAATKGTRIVAISNTHTLTAKLPDDATTLHFSPYTADEMSTIIRARLMPLMEEGVATIQPAALTFICKKVATQTGDLRACLSLLCQALAMVEKTAQEKKPPSPTLIPVGMTDVLKASKAATATAPTVGFKVKELNMQSRLVLLTFLIASRRLTSGLTLLPSSSTTKKEKSAPTKQASITATALHTLYESTLAAHGGVFSPVSRSEFLDVLGVLEVQGLLSMDDQAGSKATKSPSKRQGSRERNVSLPAGVRVDEVVKVLTTVDDAGAKEQEIRRMWEKQACAVDKEAQRQRTAHALKAVAFTDAVEA